MVELVLGRMNINTLRNPVSVMLAIAVTFGLFLLMFKLISSGDSGNEELAAIAGIRFGPVDITDEVTLKNRQIPKKPPPIVKLPQPPKLQVSKMKQPVQTLPVPELPELDVPLSAGEGSYPGESRPLPAAV